MAERIVFDLDQTLTSGFKVYDNVLPRPGAEWLLTQLVSLDHTLILWTSAGSGWVQEVARIVPYLSLFSEVYTSDQPPPTEEVAKLLKYPRNSDQWKLGQRIHKILKGLGKYPPLVGGRILVDDRPPFTTEGFMWVYSNSEENEPEDEWARRVLQALLAL